MLHQYLRDMVSWTSHRVH